MLDHGTRRFTLALCQFAQPSNSWQPSVPGQPNLLSASTVHPSSPQIGLHELGPRSHNLSQRNFSPFPNANFPIEVTLFGMVTVVSLVHLENAYCPIEVTLFGMVTDSRLVHPLNAESPIEVTLFGMVTNVRLVHPPNASVPIEVTLFGMVTDVRLLHPENAQLPIEVTLFGMED